MTFKIEAQLHLWPWSLVAKDETVNLNTGTASFPYWGSPVLSISTQAKLFLPQRYERFIPLGPKFETISGQYQLYETPHGVISSKSRDMQIPARHIRIDSKKSSEIVKLLPHGAKPRVIELKNEENETKLARVVLSWSQFFDDLIDKSKTTRRENKLPWAKIANIVLRLSDEAKEPRMALIVDIAERINRRIAFIVSAARKILLRERKMLNAGQVVESDTACLLWIIRQPGKTIAQKAAANRQRLLGIARRESYDTLENRVLRDFLLRCQHEGRRYLNTEVGSDVQLKRSKRRQVVESFTYLCKELYGSAHFENVSVPPPALRPNYVLQNDYRYKQVWQNYIRLLKREDEEDRLWDWQSRTWADVARFLVSSAIFQLSHKDAQGASAIIDIEELLTSAIHLLKEQHLGSRIAAGSEPGPFLVKRKGVDRSAAAILEIVHPDLAAEHPATKLFGRLGGHLYLVLTPLNNQQKSVFVVWAVHTASAESHPEWSQIGRSAGQALQKHATILEELRDPELPKLRGFVVASETESDSVELYPGYKEAVHLLQVTTDQRCWKDALAGITAIIEEILQETL
jgi:hypothetical protein